MTDSAGTGQEEEGPTTGFIWCAAGQKGKRSCIVRCWGAKHCPGHSQNMGLPLVKHKFGGWKTSEVLATGRHKGNDGGKKSMRFS